MVEEEGFDLWYVCDECMNPINENMFRFDCTRCDNFTFCQKCFKKNKTHMHKFSKHKVGPGQGPPVNHQELIAKAFMLCCECNDNLLELSKRVYTCKECSPNLGDGDAIYWCKKCHDKTEHEHKREKLKGDAGNPFAKPGKEGDKDESKKYLDNLFEEYHNLDYEDVIGGGAVKTRFKYTSVPKEDFGLTEEEIFLLEDKQLNQLVSLKNYRPYRNLKEGDGEDDSNPQGDYRKSKKADVNVHAVIARKKEFKKELNERLDLVKKVT
jgi:hypothetical protein